MPAAARPIRFWMFIAFLHGLAVLAGVIVTVTNLLTLKPRLPGTAPHVAPSTP